MSRRRRKPLPTEPQQAHIDNLSHEGRGIAHINGKTTFINAALPGEEVTFKYTYVSSRYDEGEALEVQQASPHRVTAKCKHVDFCGGCSLQHMHPQQQIHHKQAVLLEHLQHQGGTQPQHCLEPLSSPSWQYRHKARLGVRHVPKKGKVLVGFREKNSRYLANLEQCEILAPPLNELITPLSDLIGQFSCPDKIAQIETAVGEASCALIIRHLVPLSDNDQALLTAFAKQHQLDIYLQPGGPKTINKFYPQDNNDYLSYSLAKHNIALHFKATDFTQINPHINQQMIDRSIALLELKASDHVLDLFCGLGNFSLPMARYAAHVTGVEGDGAMVERAEYNAALNQISNTTFYSADLTQDLSKESWTQSLINEPLPINKLLLDPPRSGADALLKQLLPIQQPERIVYVSCNPATLGRDTAIIIAHGYQLVSAGVMDMFPHTAHVESIALFVRTNHG